MSHSNLVTRAKQGDADAIVSLLAKVLQQHQVAVKGRLQGSCLQLLLEFAEPLEQTFVTNLIERGMKHLQPEGIQSVNISGRLIGATKLAWRSSFPLGIPGSQKSEEIGLPTLTQESHWPSPVKPEYASRPPQKETSSGSNYSPLIDSTGWGALITGLILGILLFAIAFLKIIFRGFIVMVHEVGHAITHWAFGRPALPTVNLLHGGGITLHFEQVPLLIVLIYAGIGWLFYWQRSYPSRLVALGIGTFLYSYCLLTPTNEMLSVFMGHGMELIAIAICLFLSASGYFCRFTGDRTIYAMLGFFTLFNDIEFAWQLTHDPDIRSWYEGGIGGLIDNDFMILANEYWNVDLSIIANTFLLGCLMTPAIAGLSLYLLKKQRRANHSSAT